MFTRVVTWNYLNYKKCNPILSWCWFWWLPRSSFRSSLLLLLGSHYHFRVLKLEERLLCAVWPLQAFSLLVETRTRLPGFSLQPPPQSSSKHSRAWYPTHNMVLLFHLLLLNFPTSIYILGTALVILLGQQCLSVDLLLHGHISTCRCTIKRLLYCSCFLDKFLRNSCTFFFRQTSNDSDWIHGEWLSGYIFKGTLILFPGGSGDLVKVWVLCHWLMSVKMFSGCWYCLEAGIAQLSLWSAFTQQHEGPGACNDRNR